VSGGGWSTVTDSSVLVPRTARNSSSFSPGSTLTIEVAPDIRIVLAGTGRSREVNMPWSIVSGQSPSRATLESLERIGSLPSGWLNGAGEVVSRTAITRMRVLLTRLRLRLSEPRLYPTSEGGVRAEWRLDSVDLSIEADDRGYFAHRLHLQTREDSEVEGQLPEVLAFLARR
jgi:hypothetical protein